MLRDYLELNEVFSKDQRTNKPIVKVYRDRLSIYKMKDGSSSKIILAQ